jgi:hypothetical protein
MAKMSNNTRQRIVDVAQVHGFLVLLEDGNDLYEKNLAFKSNKYPSRVYIHRDIGISATSGDFSYLRVAVHPNSFKSELLASEDGICDYINQQSKANRHHSSNYRDFPDGIPGKNEPYGMAYKVVSLLALDRLFAGLSKP